MHTLIGLAVLAALAALLAVAFGADDLTQLREWWADRRQLPEPWTDHELRTMRAELVAERSRRDRRRNPRREYRRRQHLRAAGFRLAGGPMASLP